MICPGSDNASELRVAAPGSWERQRKKIHTSLANELDDILGVPHLVLQRHAASGWTGPLAAP